MNNHMSILSIATAFAALGVILLYIYDSKKMKEISEYGENKRMPIIASAAMIFAVIYLFYYTFAVFGFTQVIFPLPEISFPIFQISATAETKMLISLLRRAISMCTSIMSPLVIICIFSLGFKVILSRNDYEMSVNRRKLITVIAAAMIMWTTNFIPDIIDGFMIEPNENEVMVNINEDGDKVTIEIGEYSFIEINRPKGYK